MLPQALGHAAPLSVHRIAGSGWPALARVAAKLCSAPNSTAVVLFGEIPIVISLVTVTCAWPVLAGCAALDATMVTLGGAGKSAGAV